MAMASRAFFRSAAARTPAGFFRAHYTARPRVPVFNTANVGVPMLALGGISGFSSSAKKMSGHEEETFEQFSVRYEKEFDSVQDVFDLQRNLNNAFAYDLVPSVGVVTAALKAARRVNDLPTAVRIFEGIKAKVESKDQYEQYLEALAPLREELGVPLKEELYPNEE